MLVLSLPLLPQLFLFPSNQACGKVTSAGGSSTRSMLISTMGLFLRWSRLTPAVPHLSLNSFVRHSLPGRRAWTAAACAYWPSGRALPAFCP